MTSQGEPVTYCRVCGVPPNKYRQAYGMDICRTCETEEIRADMMNDAPWWVEYRDRAEALEWATHRQASEAMRLVGEPITLGPIPDGLLTPDQTTVWNYGTPDAPHEQLTAFPYGKDHDEPDWAANDNRTTW